MKDSVVKYKQLTKANIQILRDLNVVFADAFEDHEKHLSRLPSDNYLSKLLSKDHFIAIAAIHQERVVGGLVAYVLDKYEQEYSEVYIYDIAVAASYRRQGIATGLIQALKPIAKMHGACVIFVQADMEDAPAIALYESLGTKEHPYHFDIPIE